MRRNGEQAVLEGFSVPDVRELGSQSNQNISQEPQSSITGGKSTLVPSH